MSGGVLVLNAGSSSLKYRVLDLGSEETLLRGTVERVDESGWDQAFAEVHRALGDDLAGDLRAVGHRVVHGGDRYTRATLVDDDVERGIEELVALAPLHNPPALAGLRATRAALPDLAQVAVFDTAYFAALPTAAATYALDRGASTHARVRRYGAHGISHQYVAGEAARFLGRPEPGLALVTLHLGNGASAAAVRDGQPLDTSMGLTPLEGLVMGTRPGDVDAGVLLHLLRHGYDVDGLEELLHHRSGLQGLAGMHDFRDLLAAVDRGDEHARTAYDVYCHRLRKYVGAYLAVLGGADAVVFTAGVGEHVPRVRRDALAGLEALGIEVDPDFNQQETDGIRRISTGTSRTEVLVVPTDEELAIARQVAQLLAGG
ncbi:MAG TPA: acetate kinase [Nocardioides sp.]|uniref:acetate/propionate family kinase n=1 Tax=Nocardioides sp. TaxID=35761 RepID=UPI002E34CCF3|nr:acetate kinase [Nocardioides sp.]HEX5086391.1 acetate kinase [Nocardioides sp.]